MSRQNKLRDLGITTDYNNDCIVKSGGEVEAIERMQRLPKTADGAESSPAEVLRRDISCKKIKRICSIKTTSVSCAEISGFHLQQ